MLSDATRMHGNSCVASENFTAADCIFRHFRDWLIATRIVNARTIRAPARPALSCVLLRAPAFLTHSDLASVRGNEVLDDLTIPRYGHSTSIPIQLGAVVFNSRKHPTRENNSAVRHQFPTRGHFERLLDSDEAAALLGIHKKTLQRMARTGEVPGVQIGDLWRFRASTLNEWLVSKLAS
jgi:excisionase family DNA binding protein